MIKIIDKKRDIVNFVFKSTDTITESDLMKKLNELTELCLDYKKPKFTINQIK